MFRGCNKMNEIILEWNATGMQRSERGEMVERSGEKRFSQKQGNRGVERSGGKRREGVVLNTRSTIRFADNAKRFFVAQKNERERTCLTTN